MSSLKLHHSLPAPVVHAGFSVSQSKSHVLAGLQDAYWSDDDGEDAECPLCLEEMDISDLNFKPCICGYQVCRFCWHHIKENLNGRCPACRREYTVEAVQFKPIAKEDHKRLTQQKKQRERERKELDALGRRHLANVRVVQRNLVYVVGIGPRFAKEELIPTLRSNEYFGQYGKISKIVIVKRTSSGGGSPVVGLYITYHRREDAARAIAAVDGTASPGGGRDVMRASYGTTKYCMGFLRGVSCSDHGCMNLHEWGDDKDCFTKEDLTTLKHTMKATESRSRTTAISKKGEEVDGLPRSAAWANKGSISASASHTSVMATASASSATRQSRRSGNRQTRNAGSQPDTRTSTPPVRTLSDRRPGSTSATTKGSSQASSSRPPTPSSSLLPQRPVTPAGAGVPRQKKESHPPQPQPSCRSPPPAEFDPGHGPQDTAPASPAIRPRSAESIQSSTASIFSGLSAPPGPPVVPPGLSAPPGVPASGIRPSRPDTTSPQMPVTPLLASQSSYQMSVAAKALLDDVTARWKTNLAATNTSPFPDLDRTLQTLSAGDGQHSGFSFNLDPKLATENGDVDLPDFEPSEANTPFKGTYLDAFPGLKVSSTSFMAPPGSPYPQTPIHSLFDQTRARPLSALSVENPDGTGYKGSFNPFAENHDATTSPQNPRPSLVIDDGERKMSRFGFAQGRKGSTAASSPMAMSPPLSDGQTHFYSPAEFPLPPTSAPSQWLAPTSRPQYSEFTFPAPTAAPTHAFPSPSVHPQSPSRFQPFESSVSESQLRDLIQTNRAQNESSTQSQPIFASQAPFHDPAIMSAKLASPIMTSVPGYDNQTIVDIGSLVMSDSPSQVTYAAPSAHLGPPTKPSPPPYARSSSPPPILSPTDFPALSSTTAGTTNALNGQTEDASTGKLHAKAERMAAKKAAAAEKAAEKQLAAQEKAAAKAAEKTKVAQEKAEKEKVALAKVQQEKSQNQKVDKVKTAKDRLTQGEKEKERAAKPEKERSAKAVKASVVPSDEKGLLETKAKLPDTPKSLKRPESTAISSGTIRQAPKPSLVTVVTEPPPQTPLLSKRPKKNKPGAKPIRIPKEEDSSPGTPISTNPVAETGHDPASSHKPIQVSETSSSNSRAQSVDYSITHEPTSVEELLEEIDIRNPSMNISHHPFFDLGKISPTAKMPLEYGPLVHALSALSVGGGSFANNIPSGSIDNAVSSFQQLLETLTQTISDLLRLLPRTTWDDSSSFDGVLRDMLKGDDFLDDGGEDGPCKEDEVAALTLALERRARWMEVQLSKLEELHRDINTAAVRAVLSFNDNGWDRDGFLPRVGDSLRRFDNIGLIEDGGVMRRMSVDELEKQLVDAKKAALVAETEVRELMEKMQDIKPAEVEG